MKVSVIVITYNQREYIIQALESVYSQKINFPIEVLIGDDCSTDGTSDVLRDYSKTHKMTLYTRESNLGASRNIYELFMSAKGEYIAVLEGDDYWTDINKLQKQVEFMDTHRRFIGSCHRFDIVDINNDKLNKRLSWIKYKKKFDYTNFEGIYMPSQISTFLFRNIFLDIERNFRYIYKIDAMISDRTITLYLLDCGEFYCFDEIMGCYRVSGECRNRNSLTDTRYGMDKLMSMNDDIQLTNKLIDFTKSELRIDIDFTPHICEMAVIALLRYIKDKDKRYLRFLLKMHKENRSALRLLEIVKASCRILLYKMNVRY